MKSFIDHQKRVHSREPGTLFQKNTTPEGQHPNKPASTQGADPNHPNQRQSKKTPNHQTAHMNSETATNKKTTELNNTQLQKKKKKQSTLDYILQIPSRDKKPRFLEVLEMSFSYDPSLGFPPNTSQDCFLGAWSMIVQKIISLVP
jgi:hypothetical protein